MKNKNKIIKDTINNLEICMVRFKRQSKKRKRKVMANKTKKNKKSKYNLSQKRLAIKLQAKRTMNSVLSSIKFQKPTKMLTVKSEICLFLKATY